MSLLKRLQEEGITTRGAVGKTAPRNDSYWDLKFSLHQRVVEKLEQEISSDANNAEEREQAEKRIREIIKEHLMEMGITLPRTEQQQLLQEMMDEVFDLGPISPLLRDPTVSEIMVNGPTQVYVERDGVLEKQRCSSGMMPIY